MATVNLCVFQDIMDYDQWFHDVRHPSITRGIRAVHSMTFSMKSPVWWNVNHPDAAVEEDTYHFHFKLSMYVQGLLVGAASPKRHLQDFPREVAEAEIDTVDIGAANRHSTDSEGGSTGRAHGHVVEKTCGKTRRVRLGSLNDTFTNSV